MVVVVLVGWVCESESWQVRSGEQDGLLCMRVCIRVGFLSLMT